jgi:zinc protease
VTGEELERARKPMLTMLEEQMRNNTWWLATIVGPSQAKPERVDWARTVLNDYRSIQVEDLNHLAKQFLGADRATVVRIVSTEAKAP